MRLLALPLVFLVVLLSSCLEHSIVVKVHKDGSGVIHQRYYSRTDTSPEDVELPSKEEISKAAVKMGSKVTVQSIEKGHNPQGWYGYEVVYQFPDINEVTLSADNSKKEKEAKGMSTVSYSFSMQDGVLEVVANSPEWDKVKALGAKPEVGDGVTIDPFARSQKSPAKKVTLTSGLADEDEMMKAASKDMRVGLFIQPADPVESSNALYQDGGLITVFQADVEELYRESIPDFEQFNDISREEFVERVGEMDGLKVDLQNPIQIRFK